MAQQIGLFGAQPRVFVDDASGRIAYHPAVFPADESARLFALLEKTLSWLHESMWMYDRTVDVPRLIARFAPGEAMPRELTGVKDRVEEYLDTRFNALSVQLYRDGNDSVAWHNDHRDELIDLPVIALVSLGATRQMLIRGKTKPRRALSVDLDAGSLLVMGGRSQECWEHTIPKTSRPVAPRISIALRQRKA